jgi:hypothetical protein
MKELKSYVAQENKWSAIFGKVPLDLNAAEDRQHIADRIDSQLSPENLTCDGELSRSQVNARYRQLNRVATQLRALDPAIKFDEVF